MKKATIFVLVTMMCFTLAACRKDPASDATGEGRQGTLVVDGQPVSGSVTVYSEYVTLSLCDVLSALGFEMSWNGTDLATFSCDGVKYEICVSEKTLVREGEDDNYLICAPGNTHYVCEVVEGELTVDDGTLHSLFCTFIDVPIQIFIDRESNCVM